MPGRAPRVAGICYPGKTEAPQERISPMTESRMSRQQFLREGVSRFLRGFWDQADDSPTPAVPAAPGGEIGWLRPPGALPEAEFLVACTRCDACVRVCPPWALKAATRLDAPPPGTPFLHDPQANACADCATRPCIAACETGALRPETFVQAP